MAVAQVDICNSALTMLGENTVAANDNSKGWNTFNGLWLNNILGPVLASYPWNALKTRVALTVPSVPITAGSYNSATATVTVTLGTTASVSAAAWAANSITFTIGAHSLQVGMQVTVAGVLPVGYNGNYTITAVTGTTIVVSNATNPGAYSSGGTLTWVVPTIGVGQVITLTGITPADWNGTFVVTASTANTVSFLLTPVDSFVSGGYMTWRPLFDFMYYFYLPADMVRAIQVNKFNVNDYYAYSTYGYYSLSNGAEGGVMPPFKIENGYLLSNESAVDLLYVQMQNPPQDPILVDLLSAKAAYEMAYPMARDKELKDMLKKEFESRYGRAKNIETNQGTPDGPQEDSWVQARR